MTGRTLIRQSMWSFYNSSVAAWFLYWFSHWFTELMKINIVPTIFLGLCQEYKVGTHTLVRRLGKKTSVHWELWMNLLQNALGDKWKRDFLCGDGTESCTEYDQTQLMWWREQHLGKMSGEWSVVVWWVHRAQIEVRKELARNEAGKNVKFYCAG